METIQEGQNSNKYITFNTIGCGSIRLAKHLVTKDRLQYLLCIDDMILVDQEGEEIEAKDGVFPTLDNSKVYLVASEKDLQSDDEEEQQSEDIHKVEKMQKQLERISKMQEARKHFIAEMYKPLHPHLWQFNENIFEPFMREALLTGNGEAIAKLLKKETDTGIYSFTMFTETFCRELIEEVESFESSGLPILRPNSMNNYGVVLDDFGFYPFFEKLREFILPITSKLYGEHGSNLDSHHAFIVQYKIGEDVDLDFHYDESEVTLNICLGKQFTGGSLYFQGLLEKSETHNENFEFLHKPGLGIIHLGKHRHGANAIKSGERYNLIVWFRNSKMIGQNCTKCGIVHNH